MLACVFYHHAPETEQCRENSNKCANCWIANHSAAECCNFLYCPHCIGWGHHQSNCPRTGGTGALVQMAIDFLPRELQRVGEAFYQAAYDWRRVMMPAMVLMALCMCVHVYVFARACTLSCS